ncbi:MAG: retropepsin-like aspartic protease [Candidatus Omnitrophica bacterium]|nr:retropepsin-like aspartic protease [Candidatus Omnitrophota bacterium]
MALARFLTAVLSVLFVFNSRVNADTIYLTNGRSVEGMISREDADAVTLEIGFGSMKFYNDQISRIERSSPESAKLIKQKWEDKRLADEAKARDMAEKKEHAPKEAGMAPQGAHVMVETLLNKKVKANLVLDTGASLVLLSANIANSLGINTNSRGGDTVELVMADGSKVRARKITLESVSVQEAEVKSVAAAILPQNAGAAVPGDGLLGMSFLNKFNFKIDQNNKKLTLEKL